MSPYLTYIKIGAAVLLLAIVAGASFHFGGLGPKVDLAKEQTSFANYKTDVEAQYAANLKTVADTLNKQIQDGLAKRAAMQKVIDDYDEQKAKPPVTAGLAGELRDATKAASCPASGHVSQAGPVAGGTQGAAAQPSGGPSAERLSGLVQNVFDASDGDAKQMIAMIKLAP